MIHLSRYQHNDALHLRANLHPVSKAELDTNDFPLTGLVDMLDEWDTQGRLSSGWRDSKIAFIAGSRPYEGKTRTTLFLFAKGHDQHMAFGLRQWARQEKQHFPDSDAFVCSSGDHPLKHRFLKVAGCEYRAGPVFYVAASC